MFRIAVAALVFVGSFHPPVQSEWFHSDALYAVTRAAVSRPEAPRPAVQKIAAMAEARPLLAQP
ncbi:MAG: hypothetical protein ABJC89_09575 [Acidobacteriota bacterium]